MSDLIFICLISALAFIAGAIAIYLHSYLRSKPKPVHPCEVFHDFTVINVQPMRGESVAMPQTVVLKRCSRCGTHAWFSYVGDWTLGDFVAKSSEISTLERMMKL